MDKEKKIAKIENEMEKIRMEMADKRLCEGTATSWTRVSGYHRSVATWSRDGRLIESNCTPGKESEVHERLPYNI